MRKSTCRRSTRRMPCSPIRKSGRRMTNQAVEPLSHCGQEFQPPAGLGRCGLRVFPVTVPHRRAHTRRISAISSPASSARQAPAGVQARAGGAVAITTPRSSSTWRMPITVPRRRSPCARHSVDASGHVVTEERALKVRIPLGVKEGQHIRLGGQGGPGLGGEAAGDLYLEVHFKPDPRYRIEARDVYETVPVTPWEAALGAAIEVPTPAGVLRVSVPANSQSGRKLRLKGRGIPGNPPGDLYLVLKSCSCRPPIRTRHPASSARNHGARAGLQSAPAHGSMSHDAR